MLSPTQLPGPMEKSLMQCQTHLTWLWDRVTPDVGGAVPGGSVERSAESLPCRIPLLYVCAWLAAGGSDACVSSMQAQEQAGRRERRVGGHPGLAARARRGRGGEGPAGRQARDHGRRLLRARGGHGHRRRHPRGGQAGGARERPFCHAPPPITVHILRPGVRQESRRSGALPAAAAQRRRLPCAGCISLRVSAPLSLSWPQYCCSEVLLMCSFSTLSALEAPRPRLRRAPGAGGRRPSRLGWRGSPRAWTRRSGSATGRWSPGGQSARELQARRSVLARRQPAAAAPATPRRAPPHPPPDRAPATPRRAAQRAHALASHPLT